MSRTLPTTITDEFTKETPAISYYMELTTAAGAVYKMANYDVNWGAASGVATLGFTFADPITWDGSSTQTCSLAIPRGESLSVLGVDFGALALANQLRNGAVKIWMRGGLDAELATALAANKLQPWFNGRMLSCAVGPQVVTVRCTTEWAVYGMTPSVRIGAPTFNFVPAAGAGVTYNSGVLQLTTEGV